MSTGDAARESRRVMGNVTLAHEDAHETWALPWIAHARQDVSYAIRQLTRERGFAFLAIGHSRCRDRSQYQSLHCLQRDGHSAMASRRRGSGGESVQHEQPRHARSVAAARRVGFHWRKPITSAPTRARSPESSPPAAAAAIRRLVRPTHRSRGSAGRTSASSAWRWRSVAVLRPRMIALAAPSAVAVISHPVLAAPARWRSGHHRPRSSVRGRAVYDRRRHQCPVYWARCQHRVEVWMPIGSASLLRPEDRWVRGIAQRPENCCVALAGRLAPGITRAQAQAELTLLDRQFRQQRSATSPRKTTSS